MNKLGDTEIRQLLSNNYQTILLIAARICMLGMFIDDGIRVGLQWKDQHRYISVYWANLPTWRPADALITFGILGQIIPCILILFIRRIVIPSCIFLIFMVIYHTILYGLHFDLHFLAVNIAIIGGLLLLIAESLNNTKQKQPTIGAGIIQLQFQKDSKSKTFIMLAGRIFLPLMFISLLRWDSNNHLKMIELFIGSLLMFLVIAGFKARQASLLLALWLLFINFNLNAWWKLPKESPYIEFAKFDFFQTFSVIGGLILIFVHGPGNYSIDVLTKKDT
uniref:Uncharacterized protein n=1 Tax=Meloidogyne incognita TaxID=6306 RepID=A0A914L6K9_MELIC